MEIKEARSSEVIPTADRKSTLLDRVRGSARFAIGVGIAAGLTLAIACSQPIPNEVKTAVVPTVEAKISTHFPIEIPNSESLDPKRGFTVEAIVKPSLKPVEVNYSGFMQIITKSNGRGNSWDLTLVYTKERNGLYSYRYEFGVADGKIGCRNVTASNLHGFDVATQAQIERPTHVAGVINDDGNLGMFVDGELKQTNSYGIGDFCFQPTPVIIGGRDVTDGFDRILGGQIQSVKVRRSAKYEGDFKAPSSLIAEQDTSLFIKP